jgi:hypothetical protein
MGWSRVVTPSGRVISRLAASGRRTSGSDCTSWLTPLLLTNTDGHQAGNNKFDNQVKAVIGWPTPVSNDDNKSVEAHLAMKERMGGNRTVITSLQVTSQLVAWPTSSGTTAETESTGRFLLNPRFSLWLQGLPEEWASCGERATLSMRKPRKRS